MRYTVFSIAMLLASATSALATVNVTSPANNSTVSSPVNYVATATSTCAKGVSAMGVYIDNVRVVVQNGASLNASVAISSGKHYTVVQEWDGCGGSTTAAINLTVSSSTSATTVAISASPASITSGSSSVLSVTATNATQVTITGSNGTSYTLPTSGGNQSVSPTATTTYTATATGASGKVTSTATVTVAPQGATGVNVSSPANNSTVSSPVSYVATATTSCAKGVSAMGVYVDNVRVVVQNGARLNASLPISNGYHYTVVQEWDGCGGSAVAHVNITVGQTNATTVAISANPASISSGASSVLSVTATNATQVTITGSNGTSYTLPTSGGNQSVSPTATTTYTATATGANGKVTSTATVTVAPQGKPTVAIAANPASINSGASSVLNVTATNATQVTITGSDGTSYTLAQSGGTQSVTPTATTTYTATATGSGGSTSASTTVTVAAAGTPTVDITANPPSISAGSSSTLTVTATNATQVTITGSDGTSYTLPQSGGTQSVSPPQTTTYTAKAVASGGASTTSATTVTVAGAGGVESINHVIFMLQENHSFDNYFGMLNPYRAAHSWNVGDDGLTYDVDGIDDKLSKITNDSDEGTAYPLFKFASTCIDDETSAFLESYGDVNRWDFSTTRLYPMDGFVHTAENFAKNCAQPGSGCSGTFTDLSGKRAMGYYDDQFLNYYYYMASQFAVSDRWFSPVSSKSVPNRIATFTGGTTQGLTADPGADDHLPQLNIATIFSELDQAKVSWKIYYTTTQGGCLAGSTCAGGAYPDAVFDYFTYAHQYLYKPSSGAACVAPTQPSSVVGDTSNSFCIDPSHIVPLPTYYNDVKNGTLSSFSFIESGSGYNDEHPGSGQSILSGQTEVAKVINALMTSPSWSDSAFFLSYDEDGGPYDHVPPVPGHSNQNTDATVGGTSVQNIPDISTIAVNADSYGPCLPPGGVPTLHCDLRSVNDPGGHSTDAVAQQGFKAQIGFRVPNIVISPFTRKHYVSHIPMDHTAVMKFVENRFIGSSTHLTARDAAQPNLLDFFDFSAVPWATPPVPPAPVTPASLGYNSCTPQNF